MVLSPPSICAWSSTSSFAFSCLDNGVVKLVDHKECKSLFLNSKWKKRQRWLQQCWLLSPLVYNCKKKTMTSSITIHHCYLTFFCSCKTTLLLLVIMEKKNDEHCLHNIMMMSNNVIFCHFLVPIKQHKRMTTTRWQCHHRLLCNNIYIYLKRRWWWHHRYFFRNKTTT